MNLPLEADRFIADVRAEMRQVLHTLDIGLPTNSLVRVGQKRAGRITVTSLDAQPEPPNLAALKTEVAWTGSRRSTRMKIGS